MGEGECPWDEVDWLMENMGFSADVGHEERERCIKQFTLLPVPDILKCSVCGSVV